jgi:redox-sensitive bicupin YhaK (pirin superfamily)
MRCRQHGDMDTTTIPDSCPANAARPLLAQPRHVVRLSEGLPTSDGAGVKLTRLIGTPRQPPVDPFLMLDAFGTDQPQDYIAGFPPHPHRGFETVTYMLKGRMRHRDNHGGEGLLVPGSVQWMTAGRGIVHSEMPEQVEGEMRGFQLWVNLPAKDKMQPPRYQDIAPERLPVLELDAAGTVLARRTGDAVPAIGTPGAVAAAKLVAGRFAGAEGPVQAIATDPLFLDLVLAAGARLEVPLPATHNAFVHLFAGSARLPSAEGVAELRPGQLAVLSPGDGVGFEAGPEGARLILVAGRPIGEPVAWHGPFVMNTAEEIREAIADYQAGRF